MISSTVKDLYPDRTAIVEVIEKSGIVDFPGVAPIDGPSYSSSPYLATIDIAERCHLYILILGGRYGYITQQGKSATELEFEAAYSDDPTKILIFKKKVPRTEKTQADFIRKVSEYHKGYYVRSYDQILDLEGLALASFRQWLQERAALGAKLHYFDHFIRLAIQRSAFPGVHPVYTVSEDHLELGYRILVRIFTVHFSKAQIYGDFWGSINALDRQFAEWRETQYGGNP